MNLPLQRNLAADGRFSPADELKAMNEDLLQGHPVEQVAWVCGCGVTTVHHLLAMEIAVLSAALRRLME